MLDPKETIDAYFDKFVKGHPVSKLMPLQLVHELDIDDEGSVIVVHHPTEGKPLVRPLKDWVVEFDKPPLVL